MTPTAPRIASVDALRGLTVAAMLLVNNPGDWGHIYAPLEHAEWHGCTPTDLVFPFFLFIVGVSVALSLSPRAEAGVPTGRLARTVLARAARILLLGLGLSALAFWLMHKPEYRIPGVLQRIGVCFAFTGLVALWVKPRGQWLLFVGLLIGWGALLQTDVTLDKLGGLPQRVDTAVLGRHAYQWDPATGIGFDPEGILSTLGAFATCLLGLRAGALLRRGEPGRMALLGAGCAIAGLAWSLALPLNKQLWTSSFVLWTGGLAALALAAAHELIDRRGWPALGRAFGINAIAVYGGAWAATVLLAASGRSAQWYDAGFGWLRPLVGPEGQSLAYALCFVAVFVVLAKWMERRGILIKV